MNYIAQESNGSTKSEEKEENKGARFYVCIVDSEAIGSYILPLSSFWVFPSFIHRSWTIYRLVVSMLKFFLSAYELIIS